MPHRSSISSRWLTGLSALAIGVATVAQAEAGTATGAATEWTQVLNNGELVSLVGQSGEQIQNQLTQISQLAQQIETQLNIYQNLLQNTATLPSYMWGKVESDFNRLRSIVDQGQSISFSMGNADDVLQQRFQSYANLKTNLPNAASFTSTYQTWSDTNRDTIASKSHGRSIRQRGKHDVNAARDVRDRRRANEGAPGRSRNRFAASRADAENARARFTTDDHDGHLAPDRAD